MATLIMAVHDVITQGVSTEEVLGLTWTALMLAIGGALGAFCRAGLSQTQYTISTRTFIDCIIGIVTGILVPVIGLDLVPGEIKIADLTSLQQSCFAFIIGFGSDAIFTSILWKFGYLKPNGGPHPRKGIFTKEDNE